MKYAFKEVGASMTTIKKSVIVPYTTAQMYALINDLEHYPEFLPWCKSMIVRNRSPKSVEAIIHGSKVGIDFSVAIINYLHPDKLIDVNLVHHRPFKEIEVSCKFEPLEKGSRFILELKFEFIHRVLGWTLTPIIQTESTNLIKAVCQRAKKIYS